MQSLSLSAGLVCVLLIWLGTGTNVKGNTVTLGSCTNGPPGKDGRDGRDGRDGVSGYGGCGSGGYHGHGHGCSGCNSHELVAFTAVHKTELIPSKHGPYPDNKVIHFMKVATNKGNDFNNSTSVFTCRIPGLYFFSFTFMGTGDSTLDCRIDLMESSTVVLTAFGRGKYMMCAAQTTLLLKRGDRVWLNLVKGHAIYSHYDNRFSGFLIHAS